MILIMLLRYTDGILSVISSHVTMQVIELQKKAGELWNILQLLLTLTEQVLTESMKKDNYVDQERKAQDKRQRVTDEIEALVRGLY